MSDRQIEMVWPCHCGTKNLGRYMKCQTCGRPKDDGVEYEMPENVEQAATVTNAALLRMATAGENWHCAYCGSDQRALDGSCGQCGAGKTERANAEHAHAHEHAPEKMVDARPTRSRSRTQTRWGLIAGLVIGFSMLLGTCVLLAKNSHQTRSELSPVSVAAPAVVELDLTVTRAHWKRMVMTDRWELVDREGFDVPADAVDKKDAGQRVHHQEQVLDHMETVYDSVQVPDGTRTESYVTQVACGQDCTTSARSCRQSCTSNKNGFATCKDICTGGTQSCKTKYCDQTQTRQVAKTRTEQRPRQEPRYRSEPRYATWYTYKAYDWVQIDERDLEGEDTTPQWPEAGAPIAVAIEAGAPIAVAIDAGATIAKKTIDAGASEMPQIRERHIESFDVTLTDDKGAQYTYTPSTPEDLSAFAKTTRHRMRVENGRAFSAL